MKCQEMLFIQILVANKKYVFFLPYKKNNDSFFYKQKFCVHFMQILCRK